MTYVQWSVEWSGVEWSRVEWSGVAAERGAGGWQRIVIRFCVPSAASSRRYSRDKRVRALGQALDYPTSLPYLSTPPLPTFLITYPPRYPSPVGQLLVLQLERQADVSMFLVKLAQLALALVAAVVG